MDGCTESHHPIQRSRVIVLVFQRAVHSRPQCGSPQSSGGRDDSAWTLDEHDASSVLEAHQFDKTARH